METMENITKELKELLEKGNRIVYTKCNHVSNSGMFRLISCFVIVNNKPINIDWYIEKITNYKRDKRREGLRVSGCGMDMGFSVVYNLGSCLYPHGDGKTITGRNGDTEPETDGGYLLKQKWL